MTTAIVNRVTGEVLHVELELGDDLWLSSEQHGTERAKRSHFPAERWAFEGAGGASDGLPVHVGMIVSGFAGDFAETCPTMASRSYVAGEMQ